MQGIPSGIINLDTPKLVYQHSNLMMKKQEISYYKVQFQHWNYITEYVTLYSKTMSNYLRKLILLTFHRNLCGSILSCNLTLAINKTTPWIHDIITKFNLIFFSSWICNYLQFLSSWEISVFLVQRLYFQLLHGALRQFFNANEPFQKGNLWKVQYWGQ
jgi:hypothetical protein